MSRNLIKKMILFAIIVSTTFLSFNALASSTAKMLVMDCAWVGQNDKVTDEVSTFSLFVSSTTGNFAVQWINSDGRNSPTYDQIGDTEQLSNGMIRIRFIHEKSILTVTRNSKTALINLEIPVIDRVVKTNLYCDGLRMVDVE